MSRRASHLLFAIAVFFAAEFAAAPQNPAPTAPLPNASDLLKRLLANERKLAAQREQYDCRITDRTIETDSKGNTKKDTSVVSDLFYVNGVPIVRTLQKDGKDLSADDQRKEDDRVMKETVKYSDQANAQKQQNKNDQEVEDFIQAMTLANGRRQTADGRSVLFYDILPNPRFDAKNLNQRIAQVMQGKIFVDEQTGELIDINVTSVADLKIGGGLVANVHKGFWFHIRNQPRPDGVWLTDLAEGSGDAREALFLHPYIHFKQTSDGCHLYSATASQAGTVQVVKKP